MVGKTLVVRVVMQLNSCGEGGNADHVWNFSGAEWEFSKLVFRVYNIVPWLKSFQENSSLVLGSYFGKFVAIILDINISFIFYASRRPMKSFGAIPLTIAWIFGWWSEMHLPMVTIPKLTSFDFLVSKISVPQYMKTDLRLI